MDINKVKEFNNKLEDKKLTIVCAESMTAGLLASTIASVSGASSVLIGSIVTYSVELKIKVLGVNPNTIKIHSAESIETTNEMTNGLKKLYPKANIFVSITGVASLSTNNYGIDNKNEVGQIYVSISYKNEMFERNIILDGKERNIIRLQAVEYIIDSILEIIENTSS
ncbi:Nicotinamide-nucleotide amidohydrolase PncC [compost metagenome]|jgi:nicotinamide-nucleotide amidase